MLEKPTMFTRFLTTVLILIGTLLLQLFAQVYAAPAGQDAPAVETKRKVEISPYVKGGTIAWDQLEGKGGHKFLLSGGLNGSMNFDTFSTYLNLEVWFCAEGLDDDAGIIPVAGYSGTLGGRYYVFQLKAADWYLYADLGYEEWDRTKTGKSWRDVGFFNVEIGAGVAFANGIYQLGVSSPFAPRTSKGFEALPRFGFSAVGKYRVFELWYIGLFYDYQALAFEYLGQHYPDAKMSQSGIFVQYVF